MLAKTRFSLIHLARIGAAPPRQFTSQAKGCGEISGGGATPMQAKMDQT